MENTQQCLPATIDEEGIDALLVAGVVFDNSTPSNRAQELYYRFLCRVSASCCRNIVVIGAVTENPEDEVVVLHDEENQPQAIVCAVPYLRDKDIRTVEHKNAKLVNGLKNHYTDVCGIAEEKQSEFERIGYPDLPIIAMGHLYTAGGKTEPVSPL